LGKLASFAREFVHCIGAGELALASVLVLLAGAMEGIGLALLAPLVDLLSQSSSETSRIGAATRHVLSTFKVPLSLPILLTVFIALVVLRTMLVAFRDIALDRLRLNFVNQLRRDLHRRIAQASWPFLMRQRFSHLLELCTSRIDRIGHGTYAFLRLPAVFFLAAIQVAIAFAISPLLTLGVLCWGALLLAALRPLFSSRYKHAQRVIDQNQDTFTEISDFLQALKIAKSHAAETRHVHAFEAMVGRQAIQTTAYERSGTTTSAVIQIAAAVTLGAFVYIAANFAHVTPSGLLIMVVIFARLAPLMSEFHSGSQVVAHMLPVFDQLVDIRKRCAANAEPDLAAVERLDMRRELLFDKVSFRYDKNGKLATLEALNFNIPAGSMTAIVGHTGAGKSTVADLLLGLITPDSGTILIDGIPLTGPLVTSWRRSVGYVPQDNFLFNDTVRANLLWACPDATEEDFRRPLSVAAVDEFIAALPQGLDTMIGERGTRLSGGERQRLGLARALLRCPTLLILDEATSALDNQTERAVQSAIERLHGTMTIIIIAHRLSTIRGADRILVLEQGRLVQSGTWDALVGDPQGAFAALLAEPCLKSLSQ
jgi:ATP-binding cassette subfamily C protein